MKRYALPTALALILAASGAVHAGIEATVHNLSMTPLEALTAGGSRAEKELCAACHMPNGDPESAASLTWNRSAQHAASYAIYDTLGQATGNTERTTGRVSVACLACHDGTQAPDIRPENGIEAERREHPFSIPYGGLVEVPAHLRNIDGSLKAPVQWEADIPGFRTPTTGLVNNATVWWVDTGEPGRQRHDIVLKTWNGVPQVECSSCHDPHGTSAVFLRVPNDGSTLCLSCHDL